jgi:hypothetical protein
MVTKLLAAAAIAIAASVAVPSVASAGIGYVGNPPASITCDLVKPGSFVQEVTTRTPYVDYSRPLYVQATFGPRGKVRACLYLQANTFANADLYLERKGRTQDQDTAWDVVRTTKGGDWWQTSSSPFKSFEGFDATVPVADGFNYRWRIQWVTSTPSYKLAIVPM